MFNSIIIKRKIYFVISGINYIDFMLTTLHTIKRKQITITLTAVSLTWLFKKGIKKITTLSLNKKKTLFYLTHLKF